MNIDQSDEAIERVRIMQRLGMASAGTPIGLIMGMPIIEVDDLPEGHCKLVPPPTSPRTIR